jgi:hypothetical protein
MDAVLVFADHGALEALPFFVPAVVIGALLIAAKLRDRLRGPERS